MKYNLQPLTVKAHTNGNEQTVSAFVALGTGLAYHQSTDDGLDQHTFTVTHISSGYRVFSGRFLSEENAKKFIAIISVLCDWNRPQADLVAHGRERMTFILDKASDLACVVLRDGKPDVLTPTMSKKEKSA